MTSPRIAVLFYGNTGENMMNVVTKLRDVTCQGCGGRGGRHVDVRCTFLKLSLERSLMTRSAHKSVVKKERQG